MEERQQPAEASGTECKLPLCVHVKQAVETYLAGMDGHDPDGLYDLVIKEVEKSLLQTILNHTGHNQTRAAKVLGLSRSTLRKKMEHYRLA